MKVELRTSAGTVVLDFDKIMDLCVDLDAEPEDVIAMEFHRKTKLKLDPRGVRAVTAEYLKYEAQIFEIWDVSGESDEF